MGSGPTRHDCLVRQAYTARLEAIPLLYRRFARSTGQKMDGGSRESHSAHQRGPNQRTGRGTRSGWERCARPRGAAWKRGLEVARWRRGWDSNPRAQLLTGQSAFEAPPLRPLRYLSTKTAPAAHRTPQRRARKNLNSISLHSRSSRPDWVSILCGRPSSR